MSKIGNIDIISASAGTGKTYRLVEILTDEIKSGNVRPEAVVAMTFTNKAAAELVERVRAGLLDAGETDAAHRLGAARIGTINAVCGGLVSDFAFGLGVSPSLQVLDDSVEDEMFLRALSRVVTHEEVEELTDIGSRMPRLHWVLEVKKIAKFARANGIQPGQFAAFSDRSVAEFCGQLLSNPVGDGSEIEHSICAAIETFIAHPDVHEDDTKGTAAYMRFAKQVMRGIRRGRLEWHQIGALATKVPQKKSLEAAAPVADAAQSHDRHPALHRDVRRCIELVYALAARALTAYQEHKRMWRTIDFTDQEALCLDLLSRSESIDRLRDQIDLVLIDEFQDTSPIQLAVFLRLAKIAKKNVWVGDQKQAIFGFRGTDPSLMDTAVSALELGGGSVEISKESWRSRPRLVDTVSDVFAELFPGHGIPEERVRIVAAQPLRDAPDDYGPTFERWELDGKRQDQRAAAMAEGVRQLVSDTSIQVRDRDNANQTRALRPGDIAVLCYKNSICEMVARSLNSVGIRAVLPRTGVMDTPEAQLLIAGMHLWLDPMDTLAAGTLARLTDFADDGDAWLDKVLKAPGPAAFADNAIVRKIVELRETAPTLGVLDVFDHVAAATDVRECCLAWGGGDERLGNIDALRVHVQTYIHQQGVGSCATPAGLLAWLQRLTEEDPIRGVKRTDKHAVNIDDDAVVISTWHRAKGLEWPMTVLYLEDGPPPDDFLGARVMRDSDTFDINKPLADRWIRFWPDPYGKGGASAFRGRVGDHPSTEKIQESNVKEQLRLLYVAWTRARDRVILAARPGLFRDDLGAELGDAAEPLLSGANDPEGAGEHGISLRVRELLPVVPDPGPVVTGAGYALREPREYPPRRVEPSATGECGRSDTPVEIGPGMDLRGHPEMIAVGNAVHGFLGADQSDYPTEDRREMAEGLLRGWRVGSALAPEQLLAASDGLWCWVRSQWPGGLVHREVPVMQRLENGSVVSGTVDWVVELDDRMVIIDHKCLPGELQENVDRAAHYAGQLRLYAEAVFKATAKTIDRTYIHLPLRGVVVPVTG